MEKHVCKKFCSFYKPDKEAMKCGTYSFLERNLSTGEVRKAASLATADFDFSMDEDIRELVCSKCDFRAEGCDYAQGLDSPPCGGYTILEHMLKKTMLLLQPQS
jgi:hypothetical protein